MSRWHFPFLHISAGLFRHRSLSLFFFPPFLSLFSLLPSSLSLFPAKYPCSRPFPQSFIGHHLDSKSVSIIPCIYKFLFCFIGFSVHLFICSHFFYVPFSYVICSFILSLTVLSIYFYILVFSCMLLFLGFDIICSFNLNCFIYFRFYCNVLVWVFVYVFDIIFSFSLNCFIHLIFYFNILVYVFVFISWHYLLI